MIVLYLAFKYLLSISTNVEFVSPLIFKSDLTLYCRVLAIYNATPPAFLVGLISCSTV